MSIVSNGRLLAVSLVGATVALVAIGTLWPNPSAAAYAGGESFAQPSSTPEAAVQNLAAEIRAQAWGNAYSSLANKAQFTAAEFRRDLTSYYPDLRTYATLSSFEVQPLHASDSDANVRLRMHWSTVVGTSLNERDLHVVRNGSEWRVEWPIQKQAVVPPQVIPVNYLRWDVINRDCR